jgi:pimeloyl-ACP methyl ester carboxylesterase
MTSRARRGEAETYVRRNSTSSFPVGFTTFPGEIFRAPRSWAEKSYPNLTYFNEVDKGGHFAAWEEPELFATEIRTAFRPLR